MVMITGFGTPASIEGLKKINRKLCWRKKALLGTTENVVKGITIGGPAVVVEQGVVLARR